MACTQGSFLLSSDTANTEKPLSLYLLKALTILGFSFRHGPHHEAQKSSNRYLPKWSLNLSSFPSGDGNAKSGALVPMAVLRNTAGNSFNNFTYCVCASEGSSRAVYFTISSAERPGEKYRYNTNADTIEAGCSFINASIFTFLAFCRYCLYRSLAAEPVISA